MFCCLCMNLLTDIVIKVPIELEKITLLVTDSDVFLLFALCFVECRTSSKVCLYVRAEEEMLKDKLRHFKKC